MGSEELRWQQRAPAPHVLGPQLGAVLGVPSVSVGTAVSLHCDTTARGTICISRYQSYHLYQSAQLYHCAATRQLCDGRPAGVCLHV